ncbi:MAG: phosphate starvation-inducible protein PhoH [Spirochaetes bacterium GWF1_31_7]|nr:MAG: phosphate starvation-inducible protein PhoH [Spirochaetes bacterium GWE1_32_154]OHD47815.1 MAG: phosphate starvation-inducible protein PhoH [Spirochaetes bacterium GWE2_31_10]OHD52543.1 MAG: phosphate starvation-inducible protein PhoH [Spirochaetes bacterium GWF1_31_7]OHD80746.1 MAG: phosphate starvation-inducible protein PhoH [Spirochaetes bacterium RIFOXYB1_FULL_32_8]HBD93418.1 ribonuclease [Spirochaetia bacterium]
MAVKNFILDTNVILHDSNCIYSFKKNNVIIPMVVLEEIDKFKKGDELKNFQARHFTRVVDDLYSNVDFKKGANLGVDRGTLRIIAGNDDSTSVIKKYFLEDIVDHRILALAYNLINTDKLENVIVVSKDINLRMKAKSLGIPAEDYTTGQVESVEELYKGKKIVEDVNAELVDRFYKENEIDAHDPAIAQLKFVSNEYAVLKSQQNSVLVRFDAITNKFRKIDKRFAYGIKPRNSEQMFSMDALLDNNIPIVALSGKAGTGKTLLALACALELRADYKQIYLARPIIPLSNKDIGYLPGDIKSKLNPYMQPLWDNLKVIKNQFGESDKEAQKIQELVDSAKLVIEPLAYIRGRTLDKIYFIVDEAQNLTPHEIKTIITRVGEKTKIIFTGDPYQIDTPYLDSKSNGLSYLIDKFAGQKLFAHITLEKGERSELAELASNLL